MDKLHPYHTIGPDPENNIIRNSRTLSGPVIPIDKN